MKIILTSIITIFFCLNTYAQTPTSWRGENSRGVYQEKNLLETWPETGPKIIWNYSGLGEGHSSPAFTNGKVYLTTMIDTMGYLVVLSEDGKLIKKVSYGVEWFESFEGSRSTPTIVGNLAYIFSSKGKLICMNLDSYSVVWQKNVFTDFDGVNIQWGVTESLVVDGDIVYCSPGGTKDNVIALNRHNGDLVWSCAGMGGASAYCTPVLLELNKRKLLVTIMAKNIIGIDAETGEMLWSFPKTNRWDVHANTPYYHDGQLYCFAGYGVGGVMLNLNDDGSKVEKLWENVSLDNKMGGVVVMDGYIYGSGDKFREWKCLDWNTGKEMWVSKVIKRGVVIAADGMMYCYSDKGELALVKPDSTEFNIISQIKVEAGTGQHWSHPVINNGRLYIRHGDALVVYNINK